MFLEKRTRYEYTAKVKKMKLYAKIFIGIVIPITLIICGTVYFNSMKQLSMAEEWVISRYMSTGQFITGYIRDNYTDLSLVAENLNKMFRVESYLFWQLRGPGNNSIQGGDPSVMERLAGLDRPYPERNTCGEKVVISRNMGYGVYDRILPINGDDYHFQLVFSLEQLERATRRIIFTNILQFVMVVVIIGATLYFLSVRVTAPLRDLVRDTKIIGRGNLRHRIELKSKDEFGELAASFNEMVANLEKTTFSATYVNNILRAMVDGLMVIEPGGKINRVNKALCKLLGYKKQELIGKPLDFVFPEARKVFFTGERWESPPGGLVNYETHYRKNNGEEVPVLLSCSMMKDKTTEKEYIICSSRDITERKKIEEELLQERNRALVTLESIGDLVATTDNRGIITYLNPAGEKITGWPGKEAQGQLFSEVIQLVDEFTRSPLVNLVEKVLQENKVLNLRENILLLNRTGRAYAVELTAAPLHGPGKEVTGVVVVIHDFTENKEMLKQVTYQATHDPLTGLINRLKFKEYLDQAIKNAKDQGRESILFFLDLDRFKIINDSCGHFAGDRLLRQLALIIKATVRQQDIVARLGGDEFGILLENISLATAFEMAEEICRTVQEFFFTWQGKFFNIGVSIGIAEISAAVDNSDYLLSAADQACSLAKKKGGNTYYLYDKNDPELSKYHGEMFWLEQVSKALEENLFELHYQPIIPIRGREREVRHEILLRLRDGKGGLVSPEVFFSAAEKHNLMPLIDRWVIKNFCSRYAQNNRRVGEPLSFYNINLSGASLNDDTFLPFVKEQLQQYAIPPEVVCFEITERIAVASFHQAVRFIQETKCLGCRFAIDDFGKGISSFNYLKHLPVDYLKIDGGFVRNMLESPLDEFIVETINRLGHFLGMKTIAEFVENEAIFNRLKEIGVDYAQGYWVANPQRLQIFLPQAGFKDRLNPRKSKTGLENSAGKRKSI